MKTFWYYNASLEKRRCSIKSFYFQYKKEIFHHKRKILLRLQWILEKIHLIFNGYFTMKCLLRFNTNSFCFLFIIFLHNNAIIYTYSQHFYLHSMRLFIHLPKHRMSSSRRSFRSPSWIFSTSGCLLACGSPWWSCPALSPLCS